MKKVAFSAIVLVIGFGFGLGITHAETANTPAADTTISPAEAAVLNQELEAMKSLLIQLQNQPVAEVPQTPMSVSAPLNPEVTLSQENLDALSQGLYALSSVLTNLQLRLLTGSMTTAERDAVGASLGGIAKTLIVLNSALQSSNLAVVSEEVASEPSPVLAETEETLEGLLPTEEASKGVASAESIINISYQKLLLSLVVGLIVAAIVVWLWRKKPEEKEITAVQPYAQSE